MLSSIKATPEQAAIEQGLQWSELVAIQVMRQVEDGRKDLDRHFADKANAENWENPEALMAQGQAADSAYLFHIAGELKRRCDALIESLNK